MASRPGAPPELPDGANAQTLWQQAQDSIYNADAMDVDQRPAHGLPSEQPSGGQAHDRTNHDGRPERPVAVTGQPQPQRQDAAAGPSSYPLSAAGVSSAAQPWLARDRTQRAGSSTCPDRDVAAANPNPQIEGRDAGTPDNVWTVDSVDAAASGSSAGGPSVPYLAAGFGAAGTTSASRGGPEGAATSGFGAAAGVTAPGTVVWTAVNGAAKRSEGESASYSMDDGEDGTVRMEAAADAVDSCRLTGEAPPPPDACATSVSARGPVTTVGGSDPEDGGARMASCFAYEQEAGEGEEGLEEEEEAGGAADDQPGAAADEEGVMADAAVRRDDGDRGGGGAAGSYLVLQAERQLPPRFLERLERRRQCQQLQQQDEQQQLPPQPPPPRHPRHGGGVVAVRQPPHHPPADIDDGDSDDGAGGAAAGFAYDSDDAYDWCVATPESMEYNSDDSDDGGGADGDVDDGDGGEYDDDDALPAAYQAQCQHHQYGLVGEHSRLPHDQHHPQQPQQPRPQPNRQNCQGYYRQHHTGLRGGGGGGAGPSTSGGGGAGPSGGMPLRPCPGPELVAADQWSDDDEEDTDTTAEQFYSSALSKDIQGIPWERLQFNRSTYRDTRLRQYRNYTNVLPDDDNGAYRAELAPLCAAPRRYGTAGVSAAAAAAGGGGGGSGGACARGPPFFSFVRNSRAVQSNIVHFQLRNLVWATSPNDVFVVHDNCVNHWNPAARSVTEVLNLAGGGASRGGGSGRVPGLGRVQVSTLCVSGDLVAAGGFMGELVVKRLSGAPPSTSEAAARVRPPARFAAAAAAGGGARASGAHALVPAGHARGGAAGGGAKGGGGGGMQGSLLYCGRITSSENGITNGLEIFPDRSHGTVIMSANNDSQLRLFAAAAGEGSLRPLARWPFEWAVNYATIRPGSHLAAVVGDDAATLLTDVHNGVTVARLQGHRDFSFAAAWHPGGVLLATGNQDTTTLVWDVRRTDEPLTRLAGRMGAIRSLRFTPDGRFLAMSEPADFVHVYDVASGFQHCQEHDFFGEIAGVAFTPDSSSLFVGVSDLTYASLMHLDRQRCEWW